MNSKNSYPRVLGQHLYKFLKNRSKTNLLASGLMLLPAIVFIIFTISQLNIPLSNWIANGSQWNETFNVMLAETLLKLLLFAPILVMFLTGYLFLESHSLGLKFSTALAAIFLISATFRIINIDLVLFSGVLCILATVIMFIDKRKTGKKDAPIVTENAAKFGLRLSGFTCIAVLVGLVSYVTVRGIKYVSWNFITSKSIGFTQIGRVVGGLEPGTIGGIKGPILGSLLLVGFCEMIAIPLGLGAAIFLAEYAPNNSLTNTIRFFIETLAGAPSVVIGLFGLTFFVYYLHMGFSLPAGGLALACMILPWNIRVAEESMKAVPQSFREASYALGATKWQTIRSTVLLPASPGAITGVLLGVGAAIGETAVIILTAGGLGSGSMNLPQTISLTGGKGQNMPNLAVWIYDAYNNINSSIQGAKVDMLWAGASVAFAGAFVLLMIFFTISIGALILRNYLAKKTRTQ